MMLGCYKTLGCIGDVCILNERMKTKIYEGFGDEKPLHAYGMVDSAQDALSARSIRQNTKLDD